MRCRHPREGQKIPNRLLVSPESGAALGYHRFKQLAQHAALLVLRFPVGNMGVAQLLLRLQRELYLALVTRVGFIAMR